MSEWAWYGYWRAILYLTRPVLLYGLTFNLVSPKCNTYPCQGDGGVDRSPGRAAPLHATRRGVPASLVPLSGAAIHPFAGLQDPPEG